MGVNNFDGHIPLRYNVTNKYWSKGSLKYHKFNPPKPIELFELTFGETYTKKLPPLVFGIDLEEKKIIEYDFLECLEGAPLIVHKRVVENLQEMCPGDFQVFDVIIKNLDPRDPLFENKDFHIINVTHRIEALDLEKSIYEIDKDHMFWLDERVFKEEDCWDGHLLAREKLEGNILFHPKLAKKFRRSKGIQFLSDTEAPC